MTDDRKKNQGQKGQADPACGRSLVGIGWLLVSGLGFTISILVASAALKGGIDVHTSNALRYLSAIALLFVYQKATGKPIKIPPYERFTALALGITVFMMGIGYLGATQYIPVSLAVLIFYTGPFFIFFISRFTEKEPLTIIRLAAIVIAFIGLSLVLDVQSSGAFQLKGILFALMAAVGMATFVTVSSLAIRTADAQAVNLHAMFGGALLFLFFFFTAGGTVSAITPAGFFKLCGSGFAIGFAYITFYAGLKVVGPVRASMLLNVEPIFTVALAVILLGESLSLSQFMGAGLVIVGIIMINVKPDPEKQKPKRA